MLTRYYFAILVIVLAATISCQAEFKVNTNTYEVQELPDVAMGPTGDFVVFWRSKHTGSRTICGQRFSAYGTPVGGEFQVSTGAVGGRVYGGPSVAMDSSGNFVVAWTGYIGDEEHIFARRYNSNGVALTDEFPVSTNKYATFENSHIAPSIAMNANGDFVIAWQAWHGNDHHTGTWGVYGRAYYSSGNPRGGEFRINQKFNASDAYVAIDDSGDFVVAWRFMSSYNSLWFRRFNANSTPKDNAVRITDVGCGYIYFDGAIEMDGQGNFTIAWSNHPDDYRKLDCYAQQFTPAGTAISDPFMVNTYTSGSQSRPSIAMNRLGQFVVTWHSGDGSDFGVYGQEYNNDATPTGKEFRVNTYTQNRQWAQRGVLGEDGKYVTVWHSDGQDGSKYGVYGEIIEYGKLPPSADFNDDGFVDLADFSVLAGEWLESGSLMTDLMHNNKIDELDLAVFAEKWLISE